MAKKNSAPTKEIGRPGLTNVGGGLLPWSIFVDDREFAPDLRWTGGSSGSTAVYRRMSTDAQLKGLMLATTLPITRFRWELDPNGAKPNVLAHIGASLNLGVMGEEVGPQRRRNRFDFARFQRYALQGLVYGHYHFEEVYEYRDPREGGDGLLHLRKLGTRPPRTLLDIATEDDGTLGGIQQNILVEGGTAKAGYAGFGPVIPADRLLAFVWDPADEGDHVGQALDPETPMPTPDGWRTIDDLREGDKVFDEQGHVAYVTATAEWEDRPCYEIEFGDGSTIIADERHEWFTHRARERHAHRDGAIRTTAEIADSLLYCPSRPDDPRRNHAIRWAAALDYAEQGLLIDPWVLGLWLGDGTANNGTIACHMDDADETVILLEEAGYPAKASQNGGEGRGRRITTGGQGFEGLAAQLRILGLKNNKRIPSAYLRGSYAQRLALLQGLMDSDGTVGAGNRRQCAFTNTNRDLVQGVAELVRSLGVGARISTAKQAKGMGTKPYWAVNFTPSGFVPFRLSRKAARCETGVGHAREWHYIHDARPVSPRRTKCIEVSSPSHLFLVGETMVPTHNSLFRACYRDWLVKDALVRIDATLHQRNGMGVPWFEVDANASDKQVKELAEVAERWRAGEASGGAGPGKLTLKGVEGTLPDTIGSIRYHDQQMSRAFLLLFYDLGTTQTGSRALGGDFIDWYADAQDGIADWFRNTAQQQIEREVELNWGPDEQPPLLSYQRMEATEMSLQDLVSAASAGLIALDDELGSYLTQRWHLPKGAGAIKPTAEPGTATEPAKPIPPAQQESPPAAGQPKRSALASALTQAVTSPMRWPDAARAVGANPKDGTARRARDQLVAAGAIERRPDGMLAPVPDAGIQVGDRELRREPLQFEIDAAVDFAAMEEVYTSGRDTLLEAVRAAQSAQIDELAESVEAAAGDATRLASLSVEPVPTELIEEHLLEIAAAGVASAREEREAQLGPAANRDTGRDISAAEIQPRPSAAAEPEADQAAIDARIAAEAAAVALTLAGGLAASASKRATMLRELPAAEAAALTREFLLSLKGAALEEQIGGAVTHAYGTGRQEYMKAADPKLVYASEAMDQNTCSACSSVDGTEYPSVEASEGDYPAGAGYVNCEAGLRCRGGAIATY